MSGMPGSGPEGAPDLNQTADLSIEPGSTGAMGEQIGLLEAREAEASVSQERVISALVATQELLREAAEAVSAPIRTLQPETQPKSLLRRAAESVIPRRRQVAAVLSGAIALSTIGSGFANRLDTDTARAATTTSLATDTFGNKAVSDTGKDGSSKKDSGKGDSKSSDKSGSGDTTKGTGKGTSGSGSGGSTSGASSSTATTRQKMLDKTRAAKTVPEAMRAMHSTPDNSKQNIHEIFKMPAKEVEHPDGAMCSVESEYPGGSVGPLNFAEALAFCSVGDEGFAAMTYNALHDRPDDTTLPKGITNAHALKYIEWKMTAPDTTFDTESPDNAVFGNHGQKQNDQLPFAAGHVTMDGTKKMAVMKTGNGKEVIAKLFGNSCINLGGLSPIIVEQVPVPVVPVTPAPQIREVVKEKVVVREVHKHHRRTPPPIVEICSGDTSNTGTNNGIGGNAQGGNCSVNVVEVTTVNTPPPPQKPPKPLPIKEVQPQAGPDLPNTQDSHSASGGQDNSEQSSGTGPNNTSTGNGDQQSGAPAQGSGDQSQQQPPAITGGNSINGNPNTPPANLPVVQGTTQGGGVSPGSI